MHDQVMPAERAGDGTGAGGTVVVPARTDMPSADEIARIAQRTTLDALLAARQRFGAKTVALEDGDKRRLTYDELVRAAAALSRVIKRRVSGDVVGILLATSAASAVAYYATLAAGKVPALLNFTAPAETLLTACRKGNVSAILTADRFLDVAKLRPLADRLSEAAPVLPLEALRDVVGWRDKAFAGLAAPSGVLTGGDADAPGAIVFTSGSEGEPKGVVLSHRNLLANVEQVRLGLPVERVRVFFNPLPVFHSYGLGPGLILPLTLGLRLILHPSPLRAKEVAARIAETQANVVLATDTFLRQYMRAGGPDSLSSLQFAVCGAERVRPDTRDMAHEAFGFTVVEGYGVTETSPVLSANHPDDIRDGTVGKLFAGIEARIEPVAGMADGGRLLVRGPNVMAGYLSPDGSIERPADGWHDTGDVAALENGYIAIRGRLKRFAKIGGEMTSLATVENVAGKVWPGSVHAAAAVPGANRSERIILLTEDARATMDALWAQMQADGLPGRFRPERIVHVDAVPVLGTGKLDTVAVTALARQFTTDGA